MKIVFRVYCDTKYGENVFVVGNTDEMGLWNPDAAIPLSYVKYGWWEGSIAPIFTKGLEYKYIKKVNGGYIWETGKNRDFEFIEMDKDPHIVIDVWSQRNNSANVGNGASGTSLKIMTYNVRYDTSRDGNNSWEHRKADVAKLVQMNAPDVIGLQEPLYHQVKDLESALKENYSWIGTGRDGRGNEGELNPIFYNHHLFHIMDNGTFWVSENPEAPGSVSWDSRCKRICTWAKLVVKSNNSAIYVFNTHLDYESELAREKGLELIFSKLYIMSYGYPAVLCGDFNIDEPEALISRYTNPKDGFPLYMANSKFRSITPPQGPKYTFTNWDTDGICTIDYILVKPDIMVYSYNVLNGRTEDGRYCSDHRPVCAEILI